MPKKITIFLLIMFIMLLAFSFITLRIIRKFDVSSVGTKGFSSPTDTQIYNSAIEKVQTTKGYENDVIPSNPLVISSLTDSYTHFVAPVEDIVLVPPPVEVPPVVEVPEAPSMRDVSVTLSQTALHLKKLLLWKHLLKYLLNRYMQENPYQLKRQKVALRIFLKHIRL